MRVAIGDVRGVDDLHVAVLVLPLNLLRRGVHMRVVVAQLQEALDAAARVLRALAVEPVGHAHDEARALEPLALAGGNELVDDALRVVRKVAELRLPDGEVVGRDERVAELEAERAELGQRRVADDEAGLVRELLELVLQLVREEVLYMRTQMSANESS